MVICLERGADDLHMVQLMSLPPIISCIIKIRNSSAFLVLAYPGCPRKEAVKWGYIWAPPERSKTVVMQVVTAITVATGYCFCTIHVPSVF